MTTLNSKSSRHLEHSRDLDLSWRFVVALESERGVDVDALLERKLSSVLLSIATVDGNLKNSTSKANSSHILQENHNAKPS